MRIKTLASMIVLCGSTALAGHMALAQQTMPPQDETVTNNSMSPDASAPSDQWPSNSTTTTDPTMPDTGNDGTMPANTTDDQPPH